MRLWTIQPSSVWDQIRESGEARVDATRWRASGSIPPSYEWLRNQLTDRLDGYRGGFPWWCYCEKPDLRAHRHGYLHGGQRQVRLELEVEPARVQTFRTWEWNQVYCGLYLGTCQQERDWRSRLHRAGVNPQLHDTELDEPWCSELVDSWERVFEALPTRKSDAGQAGRHEAVIEILSLQDMRRVDEFETTYESYEAYIEAIMRRPR